MAGGRKGLAEFAAELKNARKSCWADTLPADVQEQLLSTDCSTAVAVAWLKSLGFHEATSSKVDNWRRNRRGDRQPG